MCVVCRCVFACVWYMCVGVCGVCDVYGVECMYVCAMCGMCMCDVVCVVFGVCVYACCMQVHIYVCPQAYGSQRATSYVFPSCFLEP